MPEGEMCHLLTQLPLKVEERNDHVVYSGSFLPVWYLWSGLHQIVTDFLYIFDWFHSWFLHFSWIEHSLETEKSKQS